MENLQPIIQAVQLQSICILKQYTKHPWLYSAACLAAYLALTLSLRFQRLRSIKARYRKYSTRESFASMTDHDAWAIQKHMLQLEFPFTALKALQFALFRTYGIPSISTLLLKTSQFSDPATSFKRYADTGALIGEFMAFEPSSDRAITALARTKFLHTGYRASGKILESDMLYTLSLFALEPVRFVEMYEWRAMSSLEECAIGTYWKSVGDALGISYEALPSGPDGFRDGLQWLEEIRAWSRRYEEEQMKAAPANRAVADKTMDVLVYGMPGWARGIGVSVATCMMDERLRVAMMYDPPPRVIKAMFSSVVAVRRFCLRYLALPRPYFMRHDVFTEMPNEYGRHHVREWNGMPYYVQPTLWNRWGPSAWVQRLMGLPLPGDEGDKYYPKGYYTPDVGPRYFEGKGRKTLEEIKERLRVERTGKSPFIKP
ncbi:uncharacterized protein CDV56_109149 [Aspergillus thermomutatus]|uniref:Uncharacterized protein n=1 Tax=Aspergillus thermomutatus TaxID=41047 RepID=A0A397HKP2_ASPTH|nr:uncharacterized protein CDV56_109149 [Aspergillus thermomutatus]RHZ63632.1 hypothetical protein CDV56_109149 [Aspergillus thermomutatus]